MAKGPGPFYLHGEVYLFEVGEGHFYVCDTARHAVEERYKEFWDSGLTQIQEFARLVPATETVLIPAEARVFRGYGMTVPEQGRIIGGNAAYKWAATLALPHKRRGYPLKLGRPLQDVRTDPRALAHRRLLGLRPLTAEDPALRRVPCADCEGLGIYPVHRDHLPTSKALRLELADKIAKPDETFGRGKPEWQDLQDYENGWRYVTCPTCNGRGHAG